MCSNSGPYRSDLHPLRCHWYSASVTSCHTRGWPGAGSPSPLSGVLRIKVKTQPIEVPTRYKLIVNLKAAKCLR
jgi:hypothetical protein